MATNVMICLDPAHGRIVKIDPLSPNKTSTPTGVVDSTGKYVEDDIVLNMATGVSFSGKSKGDIYDLTRATEELISITDRMTYPKSGLPEIVISFHCEIAGDKNKTQTTESGFRIYYWARDIVSQNFAHYIRTASEARLPNYKVGIGESSEPVLDVAMTSIIISLGFVNNPNDQPFLKEKISNLITAIIDGIELYKSKYPVLPKRSDQGKTINLIPPGEIDDNPIEESSGDANNETINNQIDLEKAKAEIMTLLTKVQRETSDMEFIKRRFFYRTGTMVMPFNPNLVIGFPSEIEVVYSSGNVETLLGQIVGLQHTIDAESGQAMTTVNFNMLRTKDEDNSLRTKGSVFQKIKKEMNDAYNKLKFFDTRETATVYDVMNLHSNTAYAKKIVKNYFPKETAATPVETVNNDTQDGVYMYLGENVVITPPDEKIIIDSRSKSRPDPDTVQGGRDKSVLNFLKGIEIPVYKGEENLSGNVLGFNTKANLSDKKMPIIPAGIDGIRLAVLQMAKGEWDSGIKEDPPASNKGPVLKYGGNPGEPYCAYFVRWCLNKAGVNIPPTNLTPPESGAVRFIRAAAEKNGTWHSKESYIPIPGDLFFCTSHIGFVLRVTEDGKEINGLDGNGPNNGVGIENRITLNDKNFKGYVNFVGDENNRPKFEYGIFPGPPARGDYNSTR